MKLSLVILAAVLSGCGVIDTTRMSNRPPSAATVNACWKQAERDAQRMMPNLTNKTDIIYQMALECADPTGYYR